jgi:hypothetical protein
MRTYILLSCHFYNSWHYTRRIKLYAKANILGYWFERQMNAPVRVRKISNEVSNNTGLPISELIARGWLYEPA